MYFDTKTIAVSVPAQRPLVIAVDGGSGSGKTTLGQELAAELSAPLISLDDFIVEASDDVLDRRGPEQNFLEAFDRRAITAALKNLRDRQALSVVEGVYSFRPEWGKMIDFRIWIEMTPAWRLQRMQIRQANSESQMRLWQATEDWFFKTHNPLDIANIVVDGKTGRVTAVK